jgi:hypothetical protein
MLFIKARFQNQDQLIIVCQKFLDTNMETYQITSQFRGYRNKEDITNLPEAITLEGGASVRIAYLVNGSQNVLVDTTGRVKSREGYTLDGQADATITPILSSFDWLTHFGQERHLRAGNSKLQWRYVASAGDYYKGAALTANQVVWADLITSISSERYNFAEFWDTSNLISKILFVNGASEIVEWTGGVANFASATSNTITKQGTTSWAEEGFYTTGSHKVIINGTEYTATGGWGTTTLTGVSPDPTVASHDVGEIVFQKPETTANTSITNLPNTLENDLIAVLNNQVYIASFKNRGVYVSKVDDFTDFRFTSPVRVVGDGALLTLDANPVALYPSESDMYISAGKNEWYKTSFKLSQGNDKESLTIERLKTAPQQAAQSQALVCGIKNNVIFISNEPTLDELGRIENRDVIPQSENISDPIKLDFDNYDFTDGSVFYFRYNIYVAVPKENRFLKYNIQEKWWEAPQLIPISRFSIINGELYGHSYANPETYKLFTGYNDNEKSMEAKAVFSYQNYGDRTNKKSFDELYSEGYIDSNTTLIQGIKYDIDGKATEKEYQLEGSNERVVAISKPLSSLGKESYGKNPLGGDLELTASTDLPPKFRLVQDTNKIDFYEVQLSFSSIGIDQRWQLLAFGTNATESPSKNIDIKI